MKRKLRFIAVFSIDPELASQQPILFAKLKAVYSLMNIKTMYMLFGLRSKNHHKS